MDRALKSLLVNLKNYPWTHYPAYKVERGEAKNLIAALEKLDWTPVQVREPDGEEAENELLLCVSGYPEPNVELERAMLTGSYDPLTKTWCINEWPRAKNIEVLAWRPLPEPYTGQGVW